MLRRLLLPAVLALGAASGFSVALGQDAGRGAARVEQAKTKLADARQAAAAEVRRSPWHREMAANVATLETDYREAKATDLPYYRMNANGKWNRARLELQKREADAVAANRNVVAAAAELSRAMEELAEQDPREARRQQRAQEGAKLSAGGGRAPPPEQGQIVRVLTLKPGAPEPVRRWFASLPAARVEYEGMLEGQLVAYQAEISRLAKASLPRVEAGNNAFGRAELRPDERAARERSRKLKEMRRTAADMRKTLEQIRADRTFIPRPPLRLQPGRYGLIGEVVINQVVDANNMIAKFGREDVWIRGIATDGLVDDRAVEVSTLMACTGTKQYSTVLGASRTIFILEPIDIAPWIRVGVEDQD